MIFLRLLSKKYNFMAVLLSPCFALAASIAVNNQNNDITTREYQWLRSSGDNGSWRYADVDLINQNNIFKLKPAWIFTINTEENIFDTVQATPVYSEGLMYVVDLIGGIYAIDAIKGEKKWLVNLQGPVGRRGLTINGSNIYVTTANGIQEINKYTGNIGRKFGDDLSYVAPIIYNNSLYVANYTTGVEKFSMVTGLREWIQPLKEYCGAGRIWSGLSLDEINKSILITTANANSLTDDQEENCLANSLIAINADNGNIKFIYQEIKNDKWDHDMVSYPIVLNKSEIGDALASGAILSLSKTGRINVINAKNGILENISKNLQLEPNLNSDLKSQVRGFRSSKEKDFASSQLRLYSGVNMSISKVGKPSFLKGLHGGFEWPGGAYDPKLKFLIAPSNNYPWKIVTEYVSLNEIKTVDIVKNLPVLSSKCVQCHGSSLSGKYISEISSSIGARHIPSLLNPVIDDNYRIDLKEFIDVHKFAYDVSEPFISANYGLKMAKSGFNNDLFDRIARRLDGLLPYSFMTEMIGYAYKFKYFISNIFNNYEFNLELSKVHQSTLNQASIELKQLHSSLSIDDYQIKSFWLPLVDIDNFPITEEPWGLLTAFDLVDGKISWSIPFGSEQNQKTGEIFLGSRNFGGVLATAGGIIFATGTVDENIYAYSSKTGKELWRYKLPYAGSAPPMSFVVDGCQYVGVVSTGGRFSYFKSRGNSIVAFRYCGVP